jgi:hypothetical protein
MLPRVKFPKRRPEPGSHELTRSGPVLTIGHAMPQSDWPLSRNEGTLRATAWPLFPRFPLHFAIA